MTGIRFADPAWLLALLAVPVVVWLGWRRAGTRQLRAAVVLRAVAVTALALALAAPRVGADTDAVDVAFLVDRSDSVGALDTAATDYLAEALATRGGDDRAAVAVFGREGRVESALAAQDGLPDFASVVDGSATDVARALRLAQGVLGSEHRRRVVLFTDGRQTQGDALAAADELAQAGVRVDVVPLAAGRSADVLVREVRAPGQVREGEAYAVTTVLTNTGDAPTDVVVVTEADDVEVDRRTVTAPPGDSEVVLDRIAEVSGTVRFEVRIETATGVGAGSSAVPQNDVGRTAVQVAGPPRVLVLEGETGAGRDLGAALDATAVPVDVVDGTVAGLPTLDRLLDYEAVVLVDVPADLVGEDGMTALDTYVRDAGRGLVAVGGDDAYGMGDYDDTALEELLPVYARIRDPKRRPSVAEALVVDVSGSMAACHCREEGFAGGGDPMTGEGGINKTDITKEAVARAIDALASSDTVGVLAFNSEAKWVLPLQAVPSDAVVDDALARLHPDGPTNVVNALDEAIAGLKDVDARLRHIVLFTDGFSEDPAMVAAASRAAEAGITLSVVATGEGTGEVLERMAEAGGGRYYPGRDLASIPDIIVNEVQIAARPLVTEGVFTPTITASAPAVDDLEATPPLLGYVATTEKPTARTILRIGAENDPLLASWQAGAGTTVAWTSDASPRWSQQWVTWEGYAGFWSDVVRSTFPVGGESGVATSASVSGDGVAVDVDATEALPEGTTGTATITQPDGTRTTVELDRTELDRFAAVAPGGVEGVYGVTVELVGPDGDVLHRDVTTAIRTYSAEYALSVDDAGLVTQIAAVGGGEVGLAAAEVFAPDGLDPGRATRELWSWLALLALLTLPVDVGLRRLRLEPGDLRRLVGRLDPRRVLGGDRGSAASDEDRVATTAGALRRDRRDTPATSPTAAPSAPPPPSGPPRAVPPPGPRAAPAPTDTGPTARPTPPAVFPPTGPRRPSPGHASDAAAEDGPPPPPRGPRRDPGRDPDAGRDPGADSPPTSSAGRLLDARRRRDTE